MCIRDSILSRRLVLSTTETTPILPNDDGDLSCFNVPDEFFQEVCPILICRQEFFSCRQNEGEDNSSFRDRLHALAEDRDVMAMKFEDLMCSQYIQGVRDNELRKDLSAVRVPSLVKFNRLLDADMQSKITVKNLSLLIPTTNFHTPPHSKKGGVRNQRTSSSSSSLSEEEKRRRKTFKGKCFRCGSSDHMQPACKLPSTITCNVCHKPGHISPVCSQSANARALQQDSSSAGPSDQVHSYPALQYLPDGASAQPAPSYASASAYALHSSLPMPELPL